jgi:thiamine biosynthesis lipoprotein
VTSAHAVAFPALGTTAILVTHPARAVSQALDILETELAAIDAACSRFRADAELVALNRRAGQWVPVGSLLFAAIEVALQAYHQTGGAVDPTVARSVQLIGYDRDFGSLEPDGPPLQVMLRPAPGAERVQLDRGTRRVRMAKGSELDLGATAKAFAADRAARRAAACCDAGVLVGLGGDLSAFGVAPPQGWAVRVSDDHRAPRSAPGQDIRIHSGGLTTSSTTVRAWRRGDESLHHIIDPATGCCTEGPWRTVSVAAASCVDANTASTAALVLGHEAVGWLEERGLPARLVAHDGAVQTVGAWPSEPQ